MSERDPLPHADGASPGAGASPPAGVEPEEHAVGSTEAARGVNAGLRALARAARSFLLYDTGNEAIRAFLDQYRDEMMGAVAAARQGEQGLSLAIRPFEILWQGEVVYLERDRERSLAFRMFRDGVRRLDIGPQVSWEELLRLLQILSVRFTGVRQQEEDIVTLLWKAGFKQIEIVAVEGFTPEDEPDEVEAGAGSFAGQEGEEEDLPAGARAARSAGAVGSHVDAPHDFDLPIPPLLDEARLIPAEVPAAELEALRHEATSRSLPEHCLRLARELVALVADPTDPTTWPEVKPVVEEIRDFLLSEGQLGGLIELLEAMTELRASGQRQVQDVLVGFIDGRALRRILHSIPATATVIPDELVWLVDRLPGDHLGSALEVLSQERAPAARRVARQLIEHLAVANPSAVMARLESDPPEVAADLLRALANALPQRALEAVERAVSRGEIELALEALRVLGDHPLEEGVGELLVRLVESPLAEVRLRGLAMLAERPQARFFEPLAEVLVRRSHGAMGGEEAAAFGLTLARLSPLLARGRLEEWIRPASWWKRVFAAPVGNRWLQWAAVSGLASLPGEEVEAVIRWLAERAGEDLAQHCSRTLARRRRELPHA
jgi:hypothetical protein